MSANNFAILFSSHTDEPLATHLPFIIDSTRGEYGTLIAHFAKANPHWKNLETEKDVLVVFQGTHSYISSNWYTPPTVVPTWNYTTVHAYGKPQVIHDVSALKAMLIKLVNFHDSLPNLEAELPENLLAAIVGLEIPIERLEGKFKLSQNKDSATQDAVIAHLSQSKDSMKHEMADLMREKLGKA